MPTRICLALIGFFFVAQIVSAADYTPGTADPAAPSPGQVVTVTADADTDEKTFWHWTTSAAAVDIAVPSNRSFKFAMPSEEVTLTAVGR